MKKLAILLFLLLSIGNTQDITKDLKTLNLTGTEYTPYPNGAYMPTMYFYINGNENEIYGGHLVFQYKKYNAYCIFHRVQIIYDGRYYDADLLLTNTPGRILGGRYVEDNIDITNKPGAITLLRDISNSKNVEINLYGSDHSHKINMSQNELNIFKQYFQIFDKYLGEEIVSKYKKQQAVQQRQDAQQRSAQQIGFVIFVIGVIVVFVYVLKPKKSKMQKTLDHINKMKNR